MYIKGTYACGHEGTKYMIDHTETVASDGFIFPGYCPECDQKNMAEWIEHHDLPELFGTEKQVDWANSIRKSFAIDFKFSRDDLDKHISSLKKIYDKLNNPTNEQLLGYLSTVKKYLLLSQKSAAYWIGLRSPNSWYSALLDGERNYSANSSAAPEVNTYLENVVIPANVSHSGIAELYAVDDKKLYAKFEKDDEFRRIIKSFGFFWDSGRWVKPLNERTGDTSDRIAEVGNALLIAGFKVAIYDIAAHEKAVNGLFQPEHHNWIQSIDNHFAITWGDRNSTIYNAASKIPSAYYCKGSVRVKYCYYKEVLDFAELYDFKFTKLSQSIIDKYILEENNKKKELVAAVDHPIMKDGLSAILNSSDDVLSDLRDE